MTVQKSFKTLQVPQLLLEAPILKAAVTESLNGKPPTAEREILIASIFLAQKAPLERSLK